MSSYGLRITIIVEKRKIDEGRLGDIIERLKEEIDIINLEKLDIEKLAEDLKNGLIKNLKYLLKK